jgi:hypothetical protein
MIINSEALGLRNTNTPGNGFVDPAVNAAEYMVDREG